MLPGAEPDIRLVGSVVVRSASRQEPQAPGPGQGWLAQAAIGVTPLDVSQRKGAVPIPFPSGLGLEGAGQVAAVGPGVLTVAVGDRVGYATGPLGALGTSIRWRK